MRISDLSFVSFQFLHSMPYLSTYGVPYRANSVQKELYSVHSLGRALAIRGEKPANPLWAATLCLHRNELSGFWSLEDLLVTLHA